MTTIAIYAIGALIFSGVIGTSLAFATKPKPEADPRLPAGSAARSIKGGSRSQLSVRIADKRILTEDTSYKAAAKYSHAAARENHYYMTFETPDGTRTELEIPEIVYCNQLIGFIGTLTYTSCDGKMYFIDFVRDTKYRINGI